MNYSETKADGYFVSGLILSDTGLRWMEEVLSERFGHKWCLTKTNKGIELCLAGADGVILFDTDCDGFKSARSDQPCSHWDARKDGFLSILGSALPAPGVSRLPSPLIEVSEGNYVIHYDIVGLTYWMLARIEEVGRTDLDIHKRFPATSSHAYKKGYLGRPVVDEWLHILGQVIKRQWPELVLRQHSFDTKVSHDVDSPSLYGFLNLYPLIRSVAFNAIKKRNFRSAFDAAWIRMNTKNTLHLNDPYNTFDWIMDLSERHGLKSAFYFICGGNDPHDAEYRIDHPAIRDLMLKIHRRGHEIGLHPSFNSYDKPYLILKQAEYLREVCAMEGIEQNEWGGRMHYLQWQQPATMRAWADAGMHYDSSLGYADHAGFRCGTCFEYPGFDPVKQEILSLRVRPLIAMETTVMSSSYMALGSGTKAVEKFVSLKNACRELGGTFTLLWHNNSIKNNEGVYQEILIA